MSKLVFDRLTGPPANPIRDANFYKRWSLARTDCYFCGSRYREFDYPTPRLHTHHIIGGYGRSDEPCNLVRACCMCHSRIHKTAKPWIELHEVLAAKKRIDPMEFNLERLSQLAGRRLELPEEVVAEKRRPPTIDEMREEVAAMENGDESPTKQRAVVYGSFQKLMESPNALNRVYVVTVEDDEYFVSASTRESAKSAVARAIAAALVDKGSVEVLTAKAIVDRVRKERSNAAEAGKQQEGDSGEY